MNTIRITVFMAMSVVCASLHAGENPAPTGSSKQDDPKTFIIGHWQSVRFEGKDAQDMAAAIRQVDYTFLTDSSFTATAAMKDGSIETQKGTFTIDKENINLLPTGEKAISSTYTLKDGLLTIRDPTASASVVLEKADSKRSRTNEQPPAKDGPRKSQAKASARPIIEPVPDVCGVWESVSVSDGIHTQRMVLVFRDDGVFSQMVTKDGQFDFRDALQSQYSRNANNIVLWGAGSGIHKPITLPCTMNGNNLQVTFPNAPAPLQVFRRTKGVDDLSRQLDMHVGLYRFEITADKRSTAKVGGGEFYGKPERMGVLAVVEAGDDGYAFELSSREDWLHSKFMSPPRFDGKLFTAESLLDGPELVLRLEGHRADAETISGKFISKDSSMLGTFNIERIGPLNMNDGVDIKMSDDSHFKTGNAFEAGDSAKPIESKKPAVDLSTPENTANELRKALKDRDINRYWACTAAEFKSDYMRQIGGTEEEAEAHLRNWLFDESATQREDVTMSREISMTDETHCTIQFRGTMDNKPVEGVPLQLVKQKSEWRLIKSSPY